MIRIAIIEDEAPHAETLDKYIKRYSKQANEDIHVDIFMNGFDFLEKISELYDIVFMDVSMPNMNGIECSKKYREHHGEAVIIFVTNYAKYAVNGYEVEAMDYILKPFDYFKAENRLKKAIQIVRSKETKQIFLKNDTEAIVIKTDTIKYLEVSGHSLTFHLKDRKFTIRGQISTYEKELEGCHFFRANKFYLINLKHVTGVKGVDIYFGDEVLQVSRRRKSALLCELAHYLGDL